MARHIAPELPEMVVGEVANFSIDCRGKLSAGEKIATINYIDEAETPAVLTITNKAISTTILTIDGQDVPIGEALQCTVTGVVATSLHSLKVSFDTDSTPVATRKGKVRVKGVAE